MQMEEEEEEKETEKGTGERTVKQRMQETKRGKKHWKAEKQKEEEVRKCEAKVLTEERGSKVGKYRKLKNTWDGGEKLEES